MGYEAIEPTIEKLVATIRPDPFFRIKTATSELPGD